MDSGKGCVLRDIDGNKCIDFSIGIYVTTFGHCHPKVSEAVARYQKRLMNFHDFTTELKVRQRRGGGAIRLYGRGGNTCRNQRMKPSSI
ncbi:MAG: aminotransferase class III-fold pyridoxal phosphate-dependent enzyme [Candidatus Hydrogenedentes bacterium]|nr:aminotransferase class III-fold pyridoxal phosphate-dependent enzyme [Candidatus Hydrogenedentota bacterium]